MAELKVICDCGQKYKFDIEPVNGRMPFTVNCPACGVDGTHHANALLAQLPPPSMAGMPVAELVAPPPVPIPPPATTPAMGGLRINRPAPAVVAPPPVPDAVAPPPPPVVAQRPGRPSSVPLAPAIPKYLQTNEAIQNNSFLLGTVGAVLGAVVAVAFMVGAHIFFGFVYGVFALVMGALIGFGARLLYRGTDSSLGGMAAAVAFVTIGTTLYLMFGLLGIALDVLWLLVGSAMAFKIASG